MKTSLLFTLLLATVQSSFGQGTLTWGNNLGSPITFRAPIYDWDNNMLASISGQSSLGIPAGTTAYTTPLLAGTGFSFAIYYGPASVTDPSALALLLVTTFRTGIGGPQELPKGLVLGGTTAVPGVKPGESIKFQIRAWDNVSGTILSYANASVRQSSQIVMSAPLGGTGTDGTIYPDARTDGWTSFGLYYVPEPSAWMLGGLGALAALAFSKRRTRSHFPKV